MAKRATILFVPALLALAGWWGCRAVFPSREIRHVVLISMDTARADHLSCYGFPLPTTPHVDALAKKGVMFTHAITPLPYTRPAHSSMLTGTLPPYHGVLDNLDHQLAAHNITLPEILKENGFRTAGFVSAFVLDAKFGMAQGFDHYDDDFENHQDTMGIVERTGEETTRHVLDWLEAERGEKNFIFVHYFDPHFSYTPPEPFASRFRRSPQNPWFASIQDEDPDYFDGYPGEIAFTDHCIGRVVEKLKTLDMYDSSLIVVTGDHGEGLGEHKERTHGYFIYQSTIRVPLVIKLPGRGKSRTVEDVVSLVDLVPTVCSALGIEAPGEIHGRDLRPYLDGEPEPYPDRSVFTQSLMPTAYLANSLLGVMNHRYKYIQTTRPELYDWVDDPMEMKDRYPDEPSLARVMKDQLQVMLELSVRSDHGADRTVELDAATRKRLEALGYVGEALNEEYSFDQTAEDPKDAISYHLVRNTLGHLVARKRFAEAIETCGELIAMRPDLYLPYFEMAKVLTEEKKYDLAIINLRKTLERKPDFRDAYLGLADIYRILGDTDQTIEQFVRILEIEPDDVTAYSQLAMLLYEQGRYAEADAYRIQPLTDHPSYADMAVTLAEKLLEKGQSKLAYSHYVEILVIEPDATDVLNSLAWFEAASRIQGVHNPQRGLKHARKACELTDHSSAEFMDTLAVAYAAGGDFRMAAQTAQKAADLAVQDGKMGLAWRIQGRLRLYRSGDMYVDDGLQ